jgi:DHA2 family multidrug resistance protein
MDQLKALGFPENSALASVNKMVTQQAYMMATSDFFWLLSFGFLGLAALVWITKPQ